MVVEQAVPAAFQQAAGIARARFHVKLKPGETTFVSWKKLIKESHGAAPLSVEPPLGAHPALQARIAPEVVAQDDPLPPPNRFNSVIEKIERIYKGDDSTDENDVLNDVPDDDQYDTEDSFIDDRELNEYFSVDKAKLKHEGFFVNRGKLEREADTTASAEAAPKKRKRRDLKKLTAETRELNHSDGAEMSKAAPKTTISPSDFSNKDLFAFSAPGKQAAQKRKKDAQDCLPRHEGGSSRERNINEYDQSINRLCGSRGAANDKIDLRRLGKGDVAERLNSQASPADLGELQLITNFDRDEFKGQREGTMLSISKAKAAQKVSNFDSRETSGVLGVLKHKLMPPGVKEISPARPKGAAWERAFQDLERTVGQLCPPSSVSREPEQGKRNRLPQDVKPKLAKVARLAVKHGQLSDELIDRLMGILGHVVHVKTLKRHMKEMIETGMSALQEKEGRVQDIKREVTEMVKLRVHSLQAQDLEERELPSDDFQLSGGPTERSGGRYRWDYATEDKICDLYEQYIEGLEENRGPQIRKLYGELAELWPDGWMDNHGIKHAVQRAKERKKKQSKANIVESKKRQLSMGKQVESEGVRFPLLDLNLPGTEQPSFERGKNITALQSELNLSFRNPLHVLEALKSDRLLRKAMGKGFDPVEKKRSKMEGISALERKVKSKLEKGAVILSPNAKVTPSEYPLWRMGVRPLVALPARPLPFQPGQALLQSKDLGSAEHAS